MPIIAIDRVSRGKHPCQSRQRSSSRVARDTLLPAGLKMRLNRSLMNLAERQMPDAVTPKPQVLSIPINGLVLPVGCIKYRILASMPPVVERFAISQVGICKSAT